MSHSRLVLEISWTADVSFKKEKGTERGAGRGRAAATQLPGWLPPVLSRRIHCMTWTMACWPTRA